MGNKPTQNYAIIVLLFRWHAIYTSKHKKYQQKPIYLLTVRKKNPQNNESSSLGAK